MDFLFDQLLPREEICNQTAFARTLLDDSLAGEKVVLYGKRNMGKTSLVRSILEPDFLGAGGEAVVFADMFGVRTQDDIATRLRIALQTSLQTHFPVATLTKDVVRIAKGLRPSLSLDPVSGKMAFTLKDGGGAEAKHLQAVLDALVGLTSERRTLVVIDEFQDVEAVPGAEGLLRGAFQTFPKATPVVLMGSKKHMLARIFSAPDRPFAGWGRDREISPIPYGEYTAYLNERLRPKGLALDEEASRQLQDALLRIPEPINMAAQALIELRGKRKPGGSAEILDGEVVGVAVRHAVDRRRGRFEEFLSHRRDSEVKTLMALAKATEPVSEEQGKAFVSATGLSPRGVKKAVDFLLDAAILYRERDGLVFADPLLRVFLLLFR